MQYGIEPISYYFYRRFYMAKAITTNQVNFSGVYGPEETPVTFATNVVMTTIVSGLTATKTANKEYWVDGELLYTIVVENNSGDSYSKGVLTDRTDTANVSFDEGYGVEINGEKTTDYTFTEGILNVNLPEVKDGETLTVTFQVKKA